MKNVKKLLFISLLGLSSFSCDREQVSGDPLAQMRQEGITKDHSSYLSDDLESADPNWKVVSGPMAYELDGISAAHHRELMETGSISQPSQKTNDCCELIRVVEQNNPYWVGAEIDDRQYANVTNWYIVYRGYSQDTGQLLASGQAEILPQLCGTNSIWWWWFGVPIDPNVSYHPTCPNPNARAEFYLYMKFSHIQAPVLCAYAFKIFPVRISWDWDDPCA